MAKKSSSIKVKLQSSENTGFFYVTKKNTRPKPGKEIRKIELRKYDPIARKHTIFRETRIK